MKKLIGSLVFGLGLAALPFAASASTTFNGLLLNGLPNATVDVGSTMDATVNLSLTGASTVQSLKWTLVGSGLPAVCVQVNDLNSNGTFTTEFPIDTTGATAGTWNLTVKTYGAVPPAVNHNCDDTLGSNATATFVGQINLTQGQSTGTVINNTGHGSGTTTGNSAPNWLSALVAQMQAQTAAILAAIAPKPTPAGAVPASSMCTELKADVAAASPGMRTQANIVLQGFLLAKGMQIPALTSGHGVAFGFYGTQTSAAVNNLETVNGCGNFGL